MVELLPGLGMRLPGDAGTLSFGMTQREAAWAAASLADVRDCWVCGASWAFGFVLRDVAVSVCGGAGERLDSIYIERIDTTVRGPAGSMVSYRDIDLFGHSFDEIQRALGLFDDDGTTAKGHYCDDNRGLVIQAPREPQPAKRQVALTERKPRQLEPLRPRYITAAGVFNLTTWVAGRELSG